MALVSCIECSRQISDTAQSCPGCLTKEPRGVFCELCNRTMRRSEGFACQRSSGGWDPSYWEVTAHRTCIDAHFTPPATLACPDCGLHLAGSSDSWTAHGLWKARPGCCARCGAIGVFGGKEKGCGQCHAVFYPFQSGHGHPARVMESSEKKASCFIATAALDGGHSAELAALCSFRDNVLTPSRLGLRLVRAYYRVSPPLAAFLAKSQIARAIVRRCLVLPLAHLTARFPCVRTSE
jgi:hypothetical protein